MKNLLMILAACSFLTIAASAFASSQGNDPQAVYNSINQQIPPDNEYDGVDNNNQACAVIIERPGALLRVSIEGQDGVGGFAIFNDDSSDQVLNFKQSTDSLQAKVEVESTGYYSLKVQWADKTDATFSVGVMGDILKSNPQMINCSVKLGRT